MMNSPKTATIDLSSQLRQLGLTATATGLDDLVARATKGRWSAQLLLEEMTRAELRERSRRSLERRLARSPLSRTLQPHLIDAYVNHLALAGLNRPIFREKRNLARRLLAVF